MQNKDVIITLLMLEIIRQEALGFVKLSRTASLCVCFGLHALGVP